VEKIRRLRTILDERGFTETEIEVDGNVTLENALNMRAAGANIFVAGTSLLFRPGRMEDHSKQFCEQVR
jgi:ribulose-phosphate 3-epimerase